MRGSVTKLLTEKCWMTRHTVCIEVIGRIQDIKAHMGAMLLVCAHVPLFQGLKKAAAGLSKQSLHSSNFKLVSFEILVKVKVCLIWKVFHICPKLTKSKKGLQKPPTWRMRQSVTQYLSLTLAQCISSAPDQSKCHSRTRGISSYMCTWTQSCDDIN